MAKEIENNALALLVGAAIGIGIGILFAPDKGSETRKKIKDGLDDLKIDVNNKLADYEDGIRSKISSSSETLKVGLEKLIANSNFNAEDAIAFLEEKLAALDKEKTEVEK